MLKHLQLKLSRLVRWARDPSAYSALHNLQEIERRTAAGEDADTLATRFIFEELEYNVEIGHWVVRCRGLEVGQPVTLAYGRDGEVFESAWVRELLDGIDEDGDQLCVVVFSDEDVLDV